ncbi:MAG: SPOR domain-containing protein, partial [Chitinispirillaceae bacterium]
MALGKFLITAAVCTAVLFGCAQKEKAEDKEFSSTPKPEAKDNSSDVFDEFYVDEGKTDKKDDTESEASSYVPQFSENGRYSVQVATHATQGTADQLSSEFNGKGYPAYVAAVDNPTPELMGTYYRIRIGTFDWYSQAKAFGENILKPAGYDYWIDSKSNDNVGIEGSGFGSESSYSEQETDYSTTSQPQEETSDWSSTEAEVTETESTEWADTPETAETEAAETEAAEAETAEAEA